MTSKELAESTAYELVDELSHDDIKNFVLRELQHHNIWSTTAKMYQGAALLLFGFLLFKAFVAYTHSGSFNNFAWMGYGILFSFSFLIIIHELIHYFAYRAIGIKNASFGMQIKKFIFYVQADQVVLNYQQLKIVALAPTVIVAIITAIAGMMNYMQPLYFFYFTIFSVHSLFCGGDLGMLSYFENRKGDEILTYDDKKEKRSYFYRKKY